MRSGASSSAALNLAAAGARTLRRAGRELARAGGTVRDGRETGAATAGHVKAAVAADGGDLVGAVAARRAEAALAVVVGLGLEGGAAHAQAGEDKVLAVCVCARGEESARGGGIAIVPRERGGRKRRTGVDASAGARRRQVDNVEAVQVTEALRVLGASGAKVTDTGEERTNSVLAVRAKRAKRCSAHHWPFWQLPLSQFESLEQAAPWIPQK